MKKNIQTVALFLLCSLFGGTIQAQTKLVKSNEKQENLDPAKKKSLEKVLRASANEIAMLENKGQLPESVLYSFQTEFGGMYIEKDKITLIALKGVLADPKDPGSGIDHFERQTIRITMEGSNPDFKVIPKNRVITTYNFMTDQGYATNVPAYGEVYLKDLYPGIDLRLYSQEKGKMEFDWILEKASDFSKIRMHMEGQEGIELTETGGFRLKNKFEALAFDMPESYQLVNGKKQLVKLRYAKADDNTLVFTAEGDLQGDQPLVIDPTVLWATFMDGATVCDSYLFAAMSDPCNQVYCAGRTKASVNSAYYGGITNGFDPSFNASENMIIYTFSADGKSIIHWTYFGANLTPADMDRFDNGRFIVVGSRAGKNGGGTPVLPVKATTAAIISPAWSANANLEGFVAIFSKGLDTCFYSSGLPGAKGLKLGTTTVKIVDDSTYVVSGVSTNISASTYGTPAVAFVPGTAPDPTFGGTYEGYLARFTGDIKNASANDDYNKKVWATWVGATANEQFMSFEITEDKQHIAFTGNFVGAALTPVTVNGVTTNRAVGFPTLKRALDSIATADEGFVGVMNNTTTQPTSFDMLTYLGGNSHEDDQLCVFQEPYLFVLCNTQSSDYPGTNVAGVFDQTYNGSGSQWNKGDAVISRVPLLGSASKANFRSTYFGGRQDDFSGGIIFNHNDSNLYTFITTSSLTAAQSGGTDNFPVKNTVPGSNFYDSAKDVAGGTGGQNLDMNFAVFSKDLTTLVYSTYCGGSQRDYLGQTGVLIGSGHYDFNHYTNIYTLGTTVHSYDFNVPGECGPTPGIISPEAFDGTHGIAADGTYGIHGSNGDQHFITMFNLASQDMGDAPLSYEGGNPAKHGSNTFGSVACRFGNNLTDYEPVPASSTLADGDDLLNTGNTSCESGAGTGGDDEDGIATKPPIISVESTGNFDLSVKVANNTGSIAKIYAWIDFDGDGQFESNEAATPFSAFTYDTIRSYPNTNAKTKTIRFDLGAGKICPSQIKSGRTYLRLRITTGTLTDTAGTANVDERSHGVAVNGEVEDHLIYIRGRDYGDLPSGYGNPRAMVFADPDENGVPDSAGAVWAGNYVDIEKDCAANYSPVALGDDVEGAVDDEDGLTFPAGPITANTNYNFPLKLNSNVPGTTVYYGVWFDWDADGDFTSPQDDFVSGSGTAVSTVNVNVTSAPGGNFSPKFAIRVIVGTSPFVSTDDQAIITNGEVEDYMNDPGLLVSGTVFDDGDGIKDAQVDGVGFNSPSGTPLYAYLVNGSGNVVDVTPVNANGTYLLTSGVAATSYDVQISTTFAAVGATAPTSANLPANWESVVEQYGTNNSAGSGIEPQPANTPNSRIPVTFTTVDIANVNFGIDMRPTSDDKTPPCIPNPGGAINYPVVTLTGSDQEQGAMGAGKTIIIKTLPTGADLYYNGVLITAGSLPKVIVSYQPSALQIDPSFTGVGTVSFEYVFRDSAFLEDLTNATVTIAFCDASVQISGHVYHDARGLTDGAVDGILFNKPSGIQLYAYLLDSITGIVVDSQYVMTDGHYDLTGIINSSYEVIISTFRTGIGNTVSVVLPTQWVSTGEAFGLNNQAGIGNDPGAANSRVYVHTAELDVTFVDLALEMTNLAHDKTYLVNPDDLTIVTGRPWWDYIRAIRLNDPSGTNDTTFNSGLQTDKPGRLSGYDPEDPRYNGTANNVGAKLILNTIPDTGNALLEYNFIRLYPNPLPTDTAYKFWNPTLNRYEIDSFNADSLRMFLKFAYQVSTQFVYSYYDAAGIAGATAVYKLLYTVPLPVNVVKFSGKLNKQIAELEWTVDGEAEVQNYQLFRRQGNSSPTVKVHQQLPLKNNAINRYTYNDDLTEMPSGSYIYELKVLDNTGNLTSVGNVVLHLQRDESRSIVLYPNPASEVLQISLNGYDAGETGAVTLYDAHGNSMINSTIHGNKALLNVGNLAEGLYVVRITINGASTIQKVAVLHN